MKFKFALNVLTVAIIGLLSASTYAQSVVPVKGSASVDQLKLDVKGKPAPTTNQAAQEAKLNPANSAGVQSKSNQSTMPSGSSVSSLFSSPNSPKTNLSTSAAPASISPASPTSTAGSNLATPSSSLSGVPFGGNATASETANTLAQVSDLQAQLSLQKLSFEVDKQIQARKDFAEGISSNGTGMPGKQTSKVEQKQAEPIESKPMVTAVYSFGNRSFAEITMGNGTKYVTSPGKHLPNGMRVGRIHDDGVDLITGRHVVFYPVTAGVSAYRSVTGSAPSSVQPTAMPSSMISPSMPPVALPPMPSH